MPMTDEEKKQARKDAKQLRLDAVHIASGAGQEGLIDRADEIYQYIINGKKNPNRKGNAENLNNPQTEPDEPKKEGW